MALHTVEISPRELECVPLFPLPDVVFFPGYCLPLHVFEPRYRQLVRDSMQGSRLLCVPRIRDRSVTGDTVCQPIGVPPELYPVTSLGRIVRCQAMEDGRYNISVLGLCRVLLRERHSVMPYRVATVDLLPDPMSQALAALPAWCRQLAGVVERLLPHRPVALAQQVRAVLRAGQSAGACADQVAALLLTETDARQRVLEARDPALRLEVLVQGLLQQCEHLPSACSRLPCTN